MNKNNEEKEYVHQTYKIRADLANRLKEYRKKTGITKTFAVEKAIEEYLNREFPEENKD